MQTKITRIGSTDRAFHVEVEYPEREWFSEADGRRVTLPAESNRFEVRTRSSRRYILARLADGRIEKRTDSLFTARREARGNAVLIIDAVEGEIVS